MDQLEIKFEDKPAKVLKFEKFNEKHPRVYRAFKKKALDLIGKKPNRVISGRMIFEAVRYDIFIQKDDEELYKMNNDYCPAFTRMFNRDYPAYNGLIRTKESIFDKFI